MSRLTGWGTAVGAVLTTVGILFLITLLGIHKRYEFSDYHVLVLFLAVNVFFRIIKSILTEKQYRIFCVLFPVSIFGVTFGKEYFQTRNQNAFLVMARDSHLAAEEYRQKNDLPIGLINRKNQNVLHFTAGSGNLDAVKFYLAAGVDCGLVDENGLTPQSLAKRRGFDDVAKTIESHCAQKNLINQ